MKFPFILTLALAGVSTASELRVSAAASLVDVMTEIAELHQKNTGTALRLNFGGSNILARQIEEGAPCDVFLSADERTMERLRAKRLLIDESITPLLSNSLVVIKPQGSPLKIRSAADLDIPAIRRLALGDPAAVPAGIYAKAWLESRQVWDKVKPRVVGTENVRGALAAVEVADADVGIVYRTDAAISNKVDIAFAVPVDESPAIVYPVAVCKSARDAKSATRIITFLQHPDCTAIFEKHGFTVLKPAPEE